MQLDLSQPPLPPQTLEEAYQWMLAMWQEMRQLRQENVALRAENALLKIRVAHLEEQLQLNSANSSKPPSSDPPWRKRPPPGNGSKRRRGGQKGHPGSIAELVPVEQVDHIVEVPAMGLCPCGGELVLDWDKVDRRQVQELPPIQPVITEFRRIAGVCRTCCARSIPAWPAEAQSILGPRAAAVAAFLAVAVYISKVKVGQMLHQLLGIRVSAACISTNEARVSVALAPAVTEAHEYIQQSPVAHADESSFPQGNADGRNAAQKLGWLWVAVTTSVTFFMFALSRGQDAAEALLGAGFRGRLVADRYNAYNFISWWRRQLCWAHLVREFERIAERGGESGRIGQELLALQKQLFDLWYRVRDGTLPFARLYTAVKPIRRAMIQLLTEAAAWPTKKGDTSAAAKTARTTRKLLKVEQAMWTFTRVAGMEPTNNTAERAIRPAVLYRKNCLGTQSARGSLFVTRMLTVLTTCRQQQRDVLDFLTTAIIAHRRGLPSPSLLPEVESQTTLSSVA